MKTSDAISFFGNKVKLAEALGVTHSAICQWGDHVPPRRAYQIERLSNGKLKFDEGIDHLKTAS